MYCVSVTGSTGNVRMRTCLYFKKEILPIVGYRFLGWIVQKTVTHSHIDMNFFQQFIFTATLIQFRLLKLTTVDYLFIN